MRIEQVSRLRLIVPVPETEAGRVVRGGSVIFTVSAFAGESFRGTIARIPRSLDLKTRTMPVEADVINTNGSFLPGCTRKWTGLFVNAGIPCWLLRRQ